MTRRHERLEDDFYVTPAWAVHRFLDAFRPPSSGVWVEPSAGNGAIIRAVREYYTDGNPIPWLAIEKRTEETGLGIWADQVYYYDFLAYDGPPREDISFVIGNPPYKLAMEFVLQSIRLYPGATVAFLLRLGFLASSKRNPFMQANTPDIYVLPNRPSFAHGKTDSQEYAWFVWQPPPRLAPGKVIVLDTTPSDVRSGKYNSATRVAFLRANLPHRPGRQTIITGV